MSRARTSRPPALLARVAGVTLSAAFVLSSSAFCGERPRVGVLGDVRVEKGEVYPDDLVCIGGTATVEGKVEGHVVVVGGKLNLSGEARDVVAVATRTKIAPGAVIHGDLVHFLGVLEKDPDVRVSGQTVDVGSRLPPNVRRLLSHGFLGFLIVLRVISIIMSLIMLFLIVLIVPDRIEKMSLSLEPRWPSSLGFGLVGYVVLGVLVAILVITIIGIPLAGLLYLIVKVLGLMGVAAILSPLGKRIGLGTGLIGPEPSVLSSVMVGFLVVALVRFVPVVGELVWLALSVMGLGLALVTKAGSTTPAAAESAP